jgi:transposase-like protein
MTVLAIPPLLPQLHEAFALSQAAVAALTSLPVLLFALAALPGALLVARHGAVTTLFVGIVATGIAGALRALSPDVAILFATTFAMGVGISIMQPAFPAVVAEWTPQRIALGTAMYSNGLLVGEALSASLATANDLEVDYMKRTYGAQVPVALEDAFALLEARQRNVLRQYYAHGLGIDSIARAYRVHRSTAARWVTQARDHLVARTRDALARRVGVAATEISSLVRLLESQLEQEVEGLLTRGAVSAR